MSGRYHTKSLWFSNDFLELMKKYICNTYLNETENLLNLKFYFGNEPVSHNNSINKNSKIPFNIIQKNVYQSSFFYKLKNLGKYEALYYTLFYSVFDEKHLFE